VHNPDLIVSDVMMPRLDGLELVAALRADPRTAGTPVLLLSARAGQEAAIEGLEAGADDYLVKPFALEELLARVRALLRRTDQPHDEEPLVFADLELDPVSYTVKRGERVLELTRTEPPVDEEPLVFADLELDPVSYTVKRGDRLLELTRTEHLLLELFLENPRRVLSRQQIFERVWDYDFGPNSKALNVYVSYLRKKTEAGGEPRLIHTVRGVGYVLREP
jgi:two-component system response regulator MprA